MADLIGHRLDDFEIVRELGRGGMGVVYEARQLSLKRTVALKVLGPGLGLTGRAVQRFRREAEAAAKLHHTNIVPVYATGEADGIHFYATELIDGPSLDHVIRQLRQASGGCQTPENAPELESTGPYVPADATPPLSGSGSGSGTHLSAERFDRAAAMMAEVADALHHAHQHGVTHRDIKPSNLLLSSDGRLSVTDFGLARMLEQPGMTVTGEFVGTPAYMSPEQVTAGRIPVDQRTDIYSLGATLYELLTLRPPFQADGRDKLLALVVQKDPAAPRSVDAKIPRDLETICLKCLEKDPDRRYQSAKELADDLRRFVNRFAILAKRAGPLTRTKKWVKRNPALSVAGLALLVAVVAAGLFALQAKQDRDRLRAEQRQAAVEKAILEAMSGDAQAAVQAIADAESQGAEPGQLNLLRGLVDYHRGRLKEALVYLERAEQQLPESVAVKALLTKAYFDSGRIERAEEMATRLEQSQPKTSEDYLFLGSMRSDEDPARALRTLEGMPARARQSTLARLIQARAQAEYAQMTGQVEDAEKALDDLNKVDLPDHPLLLGTRVQALLIATHAYGATDPRRDQALGQLARDVAALARHSDNATALAWRCCYYFVRGDDEGLLAAARQAQIDQIEAFAIPDLAYSVALLYGRKDFDGVLRILQSTRYAGHGSIPVIERGFALAALPGRKEEAAQAFTEAIHQARGTYQAYVAAYLQLLGPEYAAKSREAARAIRRRPAGPIPNIRKGWYHDLLDFNAGFISADELVKKAGANRFNQCEGNFYIGLHQLGQGHRTKAKASFRRSMDTGVFIFFEYIWSRAFLARIDDPNWLPWVPVKQ